MPNDPQTTMLILSLFALPIMYKLGEAYGRYLELDESDRELGEHWEKLEGYRKSRDFYFYILAGWLLLIFLVPLFI
tara:strand:- start:352 stop:579 length:228 start_codon:yes stop_codon:yes gene_type:complete